MMLIANKNNDWMRAHYLRPLYVSLILSVFAELILFLYFGVLINDEGNMLNKFLWSVIFCGIGMGSVFGIAILVFVLDRMTGWFAISMTTALAIIFFGVCNFICFRLDQKFNYFGGINNPELFLFTGWLLSILGGLLIGTLLFTDTGNRLLNRLGI